MTSNVSERLVDQRLRNRIMEVLEILEMGDAGVKVFGAAEYFNYFYDFIPHRDDGQHHDNVAINPNEQSALVIVSRLMDDACDATSGEIEDANLIASGWPERIRPAAETALSLMRVRGRFSDEEEEATPTKQE